MTTRSTLSWPDLRRHRVGVWGLGIEGRASLRRLAAMGVRPVVVDDDPPAPGVEGTEILATSAGGLEALAGCQVVVKTPGISRYRPEVARLEGAGIPVVGGLGLWLQEMDRSKVLCITGTKGKSTTAAICGHLLSGFGYRCLVAGNIGQPPYDPTAGGDHDWWVVETSSFQVTDLASAPPVVAVTSLAPDHLDWHGDIETYYRDKLSLCTLPGARLTVADATSPALVERLDRPEGAVAVRWVAAGDPELDGDWVGRLRLRGEHNRRNALIARACLMALGVPEAADDRALARAAGGFQPLASRLTTIGWVGGVEFIDDSLSTNALPTVAALASLPGRRVALIAGGFDRRIDYAPLGEAVHGRAEPTLVVTVGASGPRVAVAVEQAATQHMGRGPVTVQPAADLEAATAAAFAWARPDGVVLLSPAAPSFGQFRDYRQRSAAFADAMARCTDETDRS